ncbi:MAG: hypothetical protein ABI417_09810 [Coleofasciculaceae cyanobacterium]
MLTAHNNFPTDVLYRHGDVLLKRVASLPHGAQRRDAQLDVKRAYTKKTRQTTPNRK